MTGVAQERGMTLATVTADSLGTMTQAESACATTVLHPISTIDNLEPLCWRDHWQGTQLEAPTQRL